ncbi:MAG TPA: alpha/beta fold hydrolase [Paracoccaceae bacterium]
MPRFLLIHGSCFGAWCWRDVLPFLDNAAAIDLPGHGADRTPIAQVTLGLYAEVIAKHLTEPTILVGHSMAGYPITAAAELAPANIRALVYLCAYVPKSGESIASMRRAGPRQPLAPAIRVSADRRSFSFDPAMTAQAFFHDCPPETRAFAARNLCPEPIAPQETPLCQTGRSAHIPRHYIRCTQDRAIPPEYQEAMTKGWPAENITTLPCSHSPFFAAPEALARHLIQIAQTA